MNMLVASDKRLKQDFLSESRKKNPGENLSFLYPGREDLSRNVSKTGELTEVVNLIKLII